MNEKLRKFLEYASENEEVKRELDALKDKEDRDAVISSAIEIAKKAGFELSAEDFAQESGELSDDELDAVAGGEGCGCVLGGGGSSTSAYESVNHGGTVYNKTCACVLGGGGEALITDHTTNKTKTEARCVCVGAGAGNDY